MIKFILTDIEGTTSSISFVHEVLFPYSQKHITSFIENNSSQALVRESLDLVKKTVHSENQIEIDDEEAILTLKDWIIKDRKHKALKDLQGLIWEAGYKNQAFKGHVYPEVKSQLTQWKNQGITLGVYSSGSVAAQKLLFGYSESGDLTPLFSFYFDTRVGAKRENLAYKNIIKETGFAPNEILFLSDIKEELDAAQIVGIKTIQLDRQNCLEPKGHFLAKSFLEINPQNF